MATQAEIGDLELALLRTFLAVVDEGSIGKAAASVDVTQSAVSQQMFRLEKIVGQKLFARERNGITLTHHGKLLVPYATICTTILKATSVSAT
jgi:DNA-binding transcriptional LysR family regulator